MAKLPVSGRNSSAGSSKTATSGFGAGARVSAAWDQPPIVIGYTRNVLRNWTEYTARLLSAAGDVFNPDVVTRRRADKENRRRRRAATRDEVARSHLADAKNPRPRTLSHSSSRPPGYKLPVGL